MNEDLGLIITGVGVGITLIGLSISIIFCLGEESDKTSDLLYRIEKIEKHIENT